VELKAASQGKARRIARSINDASLVWHGALWAVVRQDLPVDRP